MILLGGSVKTVLPYVSNHNAPNLPWVQRFACFRLHKLISKKPLLSIETIRYAGHWQASNAERPQFSEVEDRSIHSRTASRKLCNGDNLRSPNSHAAKNLIAINHRSVSVCWWYDKVQVAKRNEAQLLSILSWTRILKTVWRENECGVANEWLDIRRRRRRVRASATCKRSRRGWKCGDVPICQKSQNLSRHFVGRDPRKENLGTARW